MKKYQAQQQEWREVTEIARLVLKDCMVSLGLADAIADRKKYVCKQFTRTMSSLKILQKSLGNYRGIEWTELLYDHLETQQ